jgi:hypothetical protein
MTLATLWMGRQVQTQLSTPPRPLKHVLDDLPNQPAWQSSVDLGRRQAGSVGPWSSREAGTGTMGKWSGGLADPKLATGP